MRLAVLAAALPRVVLYILVYEEGGVMSKRKLQRIKRGEIEVEGSRGKEAACCCYRGRAPGPVARHNAKGLFSCLYYV